MDERESLGNSGSEQEAPSKQRSHTTHSLTHLTRCVDECMPFADSDNELYESEPEDELEVSE